MATQLRIELWNEELDIVVVLVVLFVVGFVNLSMYQQTKEKHSVPIGIGQ